MGLLDWTLGLLALAIWGAFLALCYWKRVVVDYFLCRWQLRKILILFPLIVSIPFLINLFIGLLHIPANALMAGSNGPEPAPIRRLWVITYHFMNSGFMPNATTEEGRWSSFLIAFAGSVLMTGILISVLTSIFHSHIESWKNGLARYPNSFRNHTIIIGFNEITVPTIKMIFEKNGGNKYHGFLAPFFRHQILVQTVSDIEKVRHTLKIELPEYMESSITLFHGGREDVEELKELQISQAKEIYILGESTAESNPEHHHDSLNMFCVEKIAEIYQPTNGKKLDCHVLFEYQSTYGVFQFSDLPENVKEKINFLPFNIYELWAQKVLVENKSLSEIYKPLDDQGISENSEKHVHLVIMGMSRMGIELAVQAAYFCHFFNFNSKGIRTRITLIDKNAKEEMEKFQLRYKSLFYLSNWTYLEEEGIKNQHKPEDSFLDIEWQFITGSLESPFIQGKLEEFTVESNSILTIAVCLPKAHEAISSSLFLPREVYEKALQILVYQTENPSILKNVATTPDSTSGKFIRYEKIKPFGMFKEIYDDTTLTIERAKYINVAYDVQYDSINNEEVDVFKAISKKEIDEKWDKLDVALKWSNIYNCKFVPTKLRSIEASTNDTQERIAELIQENIDNLMILEHNRWNMEKLLLGFRPYTEEELNHYFSLEKQERKCYKNNLKAKEHCHLDIRSFESLKEVDPGAIPYDRYVTLVIPIILDQAKI